MTPIVNDNIGDPHKIQNYGSLEEFNIGGSLSGNNAQYITPVLPILVVISALHLLYMNRVDQSVDESRGDLVPYTMKCTIGLRYGIRAGQIHQCDGYGIRGKGSFVIHGSEMFK